MAATLQIGSFPPLPSIMALMYALEFSLCWNLTYRHTIITCSSMNTLYSSVSDARGCSHLFLNHMYLNLCVFIFSFLSSVQHNATKFIKQQTVLHISLAFMTRSPLNVSAYRTDQFYIVSSLQRPMPGADMMPTARTWPVFLFLLMICASIG